MSNSKLGKYSTDWVSLVIGFVLIVVIGVLLILFFRYLWITLTSLQKEVTAAIVVASATVLVSVFSLIYSKYWERTREIELEHRTKKIPVYEEFLGFIFRMLFADKLGKPLTEKETVSFLTKFTQKLLFWGSDAVIEGYSKFRRAALTVDPDNLDPGSLFTIEDLLFAIRRDTGHKNKNLKRGDILALFINDIDKYL